MGNEPVRNDPVRVEAVHDPWVPIWGDSLQSQKGKKAARKGAMILEEY